MKRAGYSLIELLVVIAILGILAGIGSYAFGSASARSRDNTRKTDLARITNALQQYYTDNRQYPNFDNRYSSDSTRMYSAVWQLSATPSSKSCQHSNSDLAKRLTPNYLNSIPEDAKQRVNFSTAGCDPDFLENQIDRYYYLSGPSNATEPNKPATSFALMAHLEKLPKQDEIDDQNNPLIEGNKTPLGDFYEIKNYGGDINADVNYLITGQLGR